jgi:hypothetical protein
MLTASIQCLTNVVDVNMDDVYDVKTYATRQVLARDIRVATGWEIRHVA